MFLSALYFPISILENIYQEDYEQEIQSLCYHAPHNLIGKTYFKTWVLARISAVEKNTRQAMCCVMVEKLLSQQGWPW